MTSPPQHLRHDVILARAQSITAAHADIGRFFRVDPDQWRSACDRGHEARTALYSDSWFEIEHALQRGDSAAVEPAIVFLEADPWCFRLGYAKERLLRFLSRIDLSDTEKARLQTWLLSALVKGPRREYRLMTRLATRLASPEFSSRLRMAGAACSASAQRSIERVADAVDAAQTHPVERLSDEGAPAETRVEEN